MLTITESHLVSGAEAGYANCYALFRPDLAALWTNTLTNHDMPRAPWRLRTLQVRITRAGYAVRGAMIHLIELRPDGSGEINLPADQRHFPPLYPHLLLPHTVEYGFALAVPLGTLIAGDVVDTYALRE